MTFAPRTIMVATDFSGGARDAVDVAASMSRTFSAVLLVVHVEPTGTLSGFVGGLPGDQHAVFQFQDVVRRHSARELEREIARLDREGFRATPVIREGRPADGVLHAAAELEAELIVIGNHGWTGLPRVLLGSVAEAVVRAAKQPVLVVHARSRASS